MNLTIPFTQVKYEEQIRALKEELEKKKTVCEIYSENGNRKSSQYSADLSTEVAELRRAYSMLQQERDALLSAQHVSANNAEITSLILQENATQLNWFVIITTINLLFRPH